MRLPSRLSPKLYWLYDSVLHFFPILEMAEKVLTLRSVETVW